VLLSLEDANLFLSTLISQYFHRDHKARKMEALGGYHLPIISLIRLEEYPSSVIWDRRVPGTVRHNLHIVGCAKLKTGLLPGNSDSSTLNLSLIYNSREQFIANLYIWRILFCSGTKHANKNQLQTQFAWHY
jgi:hypothetical protein